MTVTTTPNKAHPARQKAIQPYLDKLQGWCGSEAGGLDLDRPAKISIGPQQVVVEAWERRLLQQFFEGTPGKEDDLASLLAHGFALVLKSTLDVERLKKHEAEPSVEIYALQAELMLDTAIGTALLHEADLAISERVQSGGVETAKSLTLFRHKLYRAVSEAKKRIADSERQQAETLAGSMTDRTFEAAPQQAESPAVAEVSVSPPTPEMAAAIEQADLMAETAPRRRPRERRPRTGDESAPAPQPVRILGRTTFLALAAGVLSVIWLLVVPLPTIFRSDKTMIDRTLIDSGADLRVVARPPSLFVMLPANQWEGMDATGQTDLVDSISAVASREGYTGAVLETDTGRVVARWLWTRGSERVTDSEDPPAIRGVTE